jgi:hypothetical protein
MATIAAIAELPALAQHPSSDPGACALLVVIERIQVQDSPQVRLAKDEDMIQAIAAESAA